MCALVRITQSLSPIMQHWSVIHSSLFAETGRRGSQERGRKGNIITISRNVKGCRYIIGATLFFLPPQYETSERDARE